MKQQNFGTLQDLSAKIKKDWPNVKVKLLSSPKYKKFLESMKGDIEAGGGLGGGWLSPESVVSYLRAIPVDQLQQLSQFLFSGGETRMEDEKKEEFMEESEKQENFSDEEKKLFAAYADASSEQKEKVKNILFPNGVGEKVDGNFADENEEFSEEEDEVKKKTMPPSLMTQFAQQSKKLTSIDDKLNLAMKTIDGRFKRVEEKLQMRDQEEAKSKALHFAQQKLNNNPQKEAILKELKEKSPEQIEEYVEFVGKFSGSVFQEDPNPQFFSQSNSKKPSGVEKLVEEFPQYKETIFTFAQKWANSSEETKRTIPVERFCRINLPGYQPKKFQNSNS